MIVLLLVRTGTTCLWSDDQYPRNRCCRQYCSLHRSAYCCYRHKVGQLAICNGDIRSSPARRRIVPCKMLKEMNDLYILLLKFNAHIARTHNGAPFHPTNCPTRHPTHIRHLGTHIIARNSHKEPIFVS